MILPDQLIANCEETAERKEWLENLPALLGELTSRWSLRVGEPFSHAGSCSWVAPVVRSDGTAAVLKLGMPHMEGAHEIEGLRFWNGGPVVQLLESDDRSGAILLERCHPGTTLRSESEPRQDQVIAGLLQRLWRIDRKSDGLYRFRHLSDMLELWRTETLAQVAGWPDEGLVREGLFILHELAHPSPADKLLHTDLHAGNVLQCQREPWVVIDPKPFIGDPSYDLVQHLINCEARLHASPFELVKRVADFAEVDAERLRLWVFGRAAAEPREDWTEALWFDIARVLAP